MKAAIIYEFFDTPKNALLVFFMKQLGHIQVPECLYERPIYIKRSRVKIHISHPVAKPPQDDFLITQAIYPSSSEWRCSHETVTHKTHRPFA
jgi:hypothetical protein